MDTFDWQTPAAVAVVLATAGLFVVRSILRRRRFKTGERPCGTGCDCPAKSPRGSIEE